MSKWRRTSDYRNWRKEVIKRDGVCNVCGTLEHLHAHHLNHASFFPEQRFLLDNGVTLCGVCHSQFHNNYKRSTRQKCTRYDYLNFLSLVEYLDRI